jgi:hypothetical protein
MALRAGQGTASDSYASQKYTASRNNQSKFTGTYTDMAYIRSDLAEHAIFQLDFTTVVSANDEVIRLHTYIDEQPTDTTSIFNDSGASEASSSTTVFGHDVTWEYLGSA